MGPGLHRRCRLLCRNPAVPRAQLPGDGGALGGLAPAVSAKTSGCAHHSVAGYQPGDRVGSNRPAHGACRRARAAHRQGHLAVCTKLTPGNGEQLLPDPELKARARKEQARTGARIPRARPWTREHAPDQQLSEGGIISDTGRGPARPKLPSKLRQVGLVPGKAKTAEPTPLSLPSRRDDRLGMGDEHLPKGPWSRAVANQQACTVATPVLRGNDPDQELSDHVPRRIKGRLDPCTPRTLHGTRRRSLPPLRPPLPPQSRRGRGWRLRDRPHAPCPWRQSVWQRPCLA